LFQPKEFTFFNGFRGGRYRNVALNYDAGGLVASHAKFNKESAFQVSFLLTGDVIIIMANQPTNPDATFARVQLAPLH
jgi:hypothetical protein